MLVEVRYNPLTVKPYSVYKKTSTGWLKTGEHFDETAAKNSARQLSYLPDIKCCIVRYENGIQLNANEV